jgi:thiol-disulfide isomerase/thioredoxin
MLNDKTCVDCFNLNTILDQIKKENVKINSNQTIDASSAEGKQLIEQFAIKKLPTFLVKGELEKNSVLTKFFSQAGDTADNTFVFRQTGGPYIDTATGKVKGKLNLILITDITCAECYDVTQHEAILSQFGMQPTSKVVDVKSTEGKSLVSKYGIKMVPAFVLSGDVAAYPSFKPVWPEVGMIASDGAYVFTKGVPFMGVYKNLTTNKVITPAPASAK